MTFLIPDPNQADIIFSNYTFCECCQLLSHIQLPGIHQTNRYYQVPLLIAQLEELKKPKYYKFCNLKGKARYVHLNTWGLFCIPMNTAWIVCPNLGSPALTL